MHLAVSVALQDAGEATRSVALARALRERCPDGHDLKISFLSHGSRFEPMIAAAGFPIIPCQPHVQGRSLAEDLGWELGTSRGLGEFVGSERIARDFITGQLKALEDLRPDVVLHGMWPFASLAARLLGLRTISFLPLPLHPTTITGGLIRDIPDSLPVLTRLPRSVRRRLARIGSRLLANAPIFHQHRLAAAAASCGWPNGGDLSLFDSVRADLTLVTDLPRFHAGYRLPDNFVITGPVFAGNDDAPRSDQTAGLDPAIVAHMRDGGRKAVLLTMGSSGTKELLFEAIRASMPLPNAGDSDEWNVVVLASPATCRPEEACAVAGDNPRLLLTDRFVPGPAANALADVVVSHGGQGTVQTALAAGTPIVGVGLQLEQQINLDNVMDAGAGIRIQRQQWHSSVIRRAVQTVLADPAYRANAAALANEMQTMDGPRTAADCMLKFLMGPGTVPLGEPHENTAETDIERRIPRDIGEASADADEQTAQVKARDAAALGKSSGGTRRSAQLNERPA